MSIFAVVVTANFTMLVAPSNLIAVAIFLWRKTRRRLGFGANEIPFDVGHSNRRPLRVQRLRVDWLDCQWRFSPGRKNQRGKPSPAGCRRGSERQRQVVIWVLF